MLNIEKRGAIGDGIADSTAILQAAIDEAGERGGALVVLPLGVWLSGSLRLRSGVELYLAEGAVLTASGEPEAFPHIRHEEPSRMDLYPWRAFIFGYGLSDVSISGKGRIACGGGSPAFQDGVGDSPDRPYGIHLVRCRGVELKDVRLENSAHWMLRLLRCSDVCIRRLDIFNHCNRNNDGLDIDSCEGVVLEDCVIDSSDDALCLKSETIHPCRDVIVRGCLLSSHASAIKLGTASIGGFINISVSQCLVRPSRATSMHHPFNLPNGMSGIDIACVDGGQVEGLRFTDIGMRGVLNPFFIKMGNRYSTGTIPKNRCAVDATEHIPTQGAGMIAGVLFSGIHAMDVGPLPGIVLGYAGNPVRNCTFRDVYIRQSGTHETAWDAALAPDVGPGGYPCAVSVARGGGMAAYGFDCRHVEGLVFDNVRIEPVPGEPRPCQYLEQVNRTGQASAMTLAEGAEEESD